MKLLLPLLALSMAQCAMAENVPAQILDCAFVQECDAASATCTTGSQPQLSFSLVMSDDGETARYENNTANPPMQISFTNDGVLVAFDPSGPTMTSVGANGIAVHSSNLIVLAHNIRAAQWTGTCHPRG
ncbi:hypothetical protein [Pararhodobacter sp.]|uniref:hypothetical protein n=1 Tax=Pararhodobacter sp. TaxID=2127056 RepID=UPI002AFE3937|nr:hypothetical protein [Pararhodobacter sp.]